METIFTITELQVIPYNTANQVLVCESLGSDFCDRGWGENHSVVADHWISGGKVSGQEYAASKGHSAESKGKQLSKVVSSYG
jgi:hypothetical protein